MRNILVVDGEKDVRDLLKDFLEENDFNVRVAADGAQTLELIEENIPGIAIVDLLLPPEYGLRLVKTIKEKYPIPLIIISSVYRKEEIEGAMDDYVVEGFLEKPLDLNKLLEKIDSINKGQKLTNPL